MFSIDTETERNKMGTIKVEVSSDGKAATASAMRPEYGAFVIQSLMC